MKTSGEKHRAANLSQGTLVSGDYNLIQDTTGCALTGTLTHVITGTDPLIGPLADYGGDASTHALLVGSPAIDWIPAGDSGCGTSIVRDQRGVTRPQSTRCDIGAYEVQALCFAEITGDDTTDFLSEDASAVQAAIDALAPTSDTVKLAGTCAGVQGDGAYTQTAYVDRDLTLQGGYTNTNWLADPNPDAYPTVLDAQGEGRVVKVLSAVTATLDSLTLTGGAASQGGGSSFGSGVHNSGNVILTTSIITGNDNGTDWGGGSTMQEQPSSPIRPSPTTPARVLPSSTPKMAAWRSLPL